MKISEKRLTNIINESVKKNLAEYKLKQYIKGLVKESFDSMDAFSQFEDKDEESEPKKLKKSENGVADFNHEDGNEEEKRAQVEKFFGKPGVDIAQYAYKLYGVTPREGEDTNEMKNARSKFMKCLNHEPNEAGYPYSFESQEVNKLQSMISSNQLNEDISPKLQSLMDAVNSKYYNINWGVLFQKFAEMYFPDDDAMIVRSMVYRRPEVGDKFADFVRQNIMQESKMNKNMKNTIKLNESQLRKIVAESVKKVLCESSWDNTATPYQDIIDRLTPIYRELYDEFREYGNGVELEQGKANQLDAANHILKAMDLLRYPEMRRRDDNDLDGGEFNGDAPDEFNPPLPRSR